ncbi:c-type cytochrome [Novosphingobium album (ex Hu et al. 2023)]|uniref:Cytochrome c n=1 Tax=Novosphingobium album (ex Hu et al. 2023) TaxID=2930093 RepID=A0ABT0B280_9SPHN|nr:cytochrome c [Novosphingobium album (ex Hu et al. 2023)]MCJ2179010.1 cytochrome c [Novosphingobium album (ex Hu et al. 2023)]
MIRSRITALTALGLAAAAMAGGATIAIAAPSASTTISTRQANFKKMGGAMKALKEQLSGTPDKAKVLDAAKTIAATARVQTKLFPAGTGPSSGVKTDALPVIWTDRTTFDGDMNKLITEADKLVAAANSGNAAAMQAQFKAVGGSCGGCHKQFRADD